MSRQARAIAGAHVAWLRSAGHDWPTIRKMADLTRRAIGLGPISKEAAGLEIEISFAMAWEKLLTMAPHAAIASPAERAFKMSAPAAPIAPTAAKAPARPPTTASAIPRRPRRARSARQADVADGTASPRGAACVKNLGYFGCCQRRGKNLVFTPFYPKLPHSI